MSVIETFQQLTKEPGDTITMAMTKFADWPLSSAITSNLDSLLDLSARSSTWSANHQ